MLSQLLTSGYKEGSVFFPNRLLPLHAMVTSCGYARETKSRYDWHGLKRGKTEFVLFQYTLSGRGRLHYEDRDFDIKQGDAMIVHIPHDSHYWLPSDSDHWEFIYMCLYGSEITRIWKDFESKAGPRVQIERDSPLIQYASEIVYKVTYEEIQNPFEISKLAYSFTMDLASLLVTSADRKVRSSAIENAFRFAEQNFHKPIDIETLAEVAGYSRYHFTRLFTESEGISPGTFILQLRIRKALDLLQTSALSVKEIAEACGFYDSTYFCKLFRTATGTSPNAFRHSGMYL